MDIERNMKKDKHILGLMVENQPGVLSRITGLFSGRGFNIESLSVAETTDPLISRITLVTSGNMRIIEQIKKHLNRLINVIKVCDYTDVPCVEREMLLVKVRPGSERQEELLRVVDIFKCHIVDVGAGFYTIEVTGDNEKIMAFLNLIKPIGIKEIVRTGTIALARES
jgi:acetolactate synthase-1/3 small subunit